MASSRLQSLHAAHTSLLPPLCDLTLLTQQMAAYKAHVRTHLPKDKPLTPLHSTTAQIAIHASYNNTHVTVSRLDPGKPWIHHSVIAWASGGTEGLKKAARGTAESGIRAAQKCATVALGKGYTSAEVTVRGVGMGREPAIRQIEIAGMKVLSIKDRTPVPHGGNKPKKSRRI